MKRREELEALLFGTKEEPVLLHPNMAAEYRTQVANLSQVLHREENRGEAADILRSLVDRIELIPSEQGKLEIDLYGDLAGILSERDIMNRVVAVGRTPGTTAVSEVMTANPRAVHADESIEECLFIMREFGFRHLPIVEGKELKGLVSLRDVLMHQAAEMERQTRRAAS